MPGGAGNVARNVSALGGKAVLVGLLGEDDAGGRAARAARRPTRGIEDANRGQRRAAATTCKMRVIAGNQQVLRAGRGGRAAGRRRRAAALVAAVGAGAARLRRADPVRLRQGRADAGGGRGAPSRRRASAGIPVFADPKSDDFSALPRRRLPHAQRAASSAARDAAADRHRGRGRGRRPRRRCATAGLPALLCTRAERGMMLVRADGAAMRACRPRRARCSTSPAPATR